jgi:Arc/MetJ-type ribon-helix-helix transcriptional regulator
MARSGAEKETTRTIRLPAETVRAIESRIEGSAFESADAFVAFVLARLLESPGGPGLTEEDERALKERLRSLGYID